MLIVGGAMAPERIRAILLHLKPVKRASPTKPRQNLTGALTSGESVCVVWRDMWWMRRETICEQKPIFI